MARIEAGLVANVLLRTISVALLPLCSFGLLAAQEKPYTVRVEVGLVSLDVAVVDAGGRFVSGLGKDSFRITEDGGEQTITHFASLEAPLTLALLVESSPAVYLIRHDYLDAVYALLNHLRPDDAIALARYDQYWQPVVDFTRNRVLLRQGLGSLDYSVGMAELNLFDALARTLEWLAPPAHPRKAVLLIGTGLNTRSQTAQQSLEEKLAASEVTLFAVATGSLLRTPEAKSGRKEKRKSNEEEAGLRTDFETAFTAADTRLRALAEQTGGRAYFPRSARELSAAYREIGERLRHTCSLGYVPTNRARDGKFRSVHIVAVGEDGRPLPYRVLTRRGYFAPRD